MSLASSPDFQMRAEDKGFDMCFLAENPLTTSFDDYINENDDRSDGDNKETFNSFLDFFEKEATVRGNGCLSPIDGSTRQDVSHPQPWREGLWCLNQNRATLAGSASPNKGSRCQDMKGKAWDSMVLASHNAGGMPFTNFSRPISKSQPHTPPHKETKRYTTTTPQTARKGRRVPQTFSREGTLSPKSSYARNQQNSTMAYQESLQCHLQNFHLLASDELGTPSGSQSARPSQPEYSAQANAVSGERHGGIVHNQSWTTPTSDSNDPYPSIGYGHVALDPGLDSLFSPDRSNTTLTAREQLLNAAGYLNDPYIEAGTVWTARSLSSAIGPECCLDRQDGPKYLGEMQQPWSPRAESATKPAAAPPYQEHYPLIAAPTPHRATHQLLRNPVSPRIDGLGIRYSGIDPSMASCACLPLFPLEPAYSYPPVPEIAPGDPGHAFAGASIFTTPRHHGHTDLSPSRSTSASISPTKTKYNFAATSRSLRQPSPTRASATGRRKSIGAPKASSFTNSHHHSTSSAKTPRTPKTPIGLGVPPIGAIDFVNFTPKDSAKLLSDVAPSGSSKTRARREQEARDKRRRLSEAAVRAVRRVAQAAGADVGDGEVEALERAILA